MCERQWYKNILISYRVVIAVAAVTTRRLHNGIQPNSCKKNLVFWKPSLYILLVLINIIYINFVNLYLYVYLYK